jgi:hypothetical protein
VPLRLTDLEDAERFQRAFVTPLVDAVKLEIRPVVEGHETLRRRVDKLEIDQKRAIWGLSAAAGVASVAIGVVLDWVKRKLGWSH